jgi:predicted site-specific integrase-resolvase
MEQEQWLTPHEVEGITRLSGETLKRWRKKNIVLSWTRIGKSIRYKASDVYQLLNTTEGALS